ncbi:unnamed protein product, partial [Laminaria digitata]
QAVLVLCRGLFTPGNEVIESKFQHHVHTAAFPPGEGDGGGGGSGGYPLADVFAEVQEGSSHHPRALRASRQAFPFLEILARWSWFCQTPNTPPPSSPSPFPSLASGGDGGGSGSGDGGGRVRGREDTGVAPLLVALAEADPSGETIRSMQRWACEALLPEQVGQAPWRATGTIVDRNEVARCLMSTRETFVVWQESKHLDWMRSCREVGDVLGFLVAAFEEEGLAGVDLTGVVNHVMFVTTFLRTMPDSAKARRGYERLVGSGRVPGEEMSFSAERGGRERVNGWREAAEVMDLGMAAVLKVPE